MTEPAGDRFVGVVVPEQRRIARRFHELPLAQVRALLDSPFHEHRNTALLILAEKVRRGDERPLRLALLDELAGSDDLWKRRVAVMSTRPFILEGQFEPTLRLARRLLDDLHDLIHKAAGWMLREIGNRDVATLTRFLDRHAARMPRTMLRYAIEKLSPTRRRRYMLA